MAMAFDFSGKTVVVAGGTSGINLGIAEAFARQGARLFVFSRDAAKVSATVDRLQALGAKAAGENGDVRDMTRMEALMADCVQRFGLIDVLISGAAGNFVAAAKHLTPNGFKAVMDIDLLGTFHVMRAAYPHLRKPGAAIVNISAPQAFIPMYGQIHVCAAKAGVDMITKTLALEWGPEGVRVNSVVPGPIDDSEGMRRLAPSDALRQKVAQSVPLRRLGSADEVASLCLMLASPLGAYVSGAIIPVDGGWSATGSLMPSA